MIFAIKRFAVHPDYEGGRVGLSDIGSLFERLMRNIVRPMVGRDFSKVRSLATERVFGSKNRSPLLVSGSLTCHRVWAAA